MPLETVKNKKLTHIPNVEMDIDSLSDLAYRPSKPLPPKSFAMYIVGQPGSGKTTTWVSMLSSRPTKKNPHKPRFYYRLFDRIYLISNSLQTLPLNKLNLNEERMFNTFSDEIVNEIVAKEKEDENHNCLLLLDDTIRDINNSQDMAKIILNRRHCCHAADKEGHGGLSVMITSQVYNWLPLGLRKNMSHVILFRTENQRELTCIKRELMADLSEKQANEVLATAWEQPHDFLFIDATKPTKDRYYKVFDKIVITK